MNRKLNISKKKGGTFRKVQYYSVCFEGDEFPEDFKFEKRFGNSEEFLESYNIIRYWLAKIGDERGASSRYFRKEKLTSEERHFYSCALPAPTEEDLFGNYVSNTDETSISDRCLRLYCLRLSDSVVVLYNGDIKTADKVQKCPNCYPYFKKINNLSSQFYSQKNVYELLEKRIKFPNRIELILEYE